MEQREGFASASSWGVAAVIAFVGNGFLSLLQAQMAQSSQMPLIQSCAAGSACSSAILYVIPVHGVIISSVMDGLINALVSFSLALICWLAIYRPIRKHGMSAYRRRWAIPLAILGIPFGMLFGCYIVFRANHEFRKAVRAEGAPSALTNPKFN